MASAYPCPLRYLFSCEPMINCPGPCVERSKTDAARMRCDARPDSGSPEQIDAGSMGNEGGSRAVSVAVRPARGTTVARQQRRHRRGVINGRAS
ncbi:hypothetical protein FSB64_35560 [Paraburkholderia sp. JPY454]|uniref:Uncharacterized protein n=1 Tax=Paraburkholderia youngii TaxID=2782701 RepID=A0ABX2NWQ4_9BURK|nr:hypothetical protein [Paraburkholderia youngii]